jgi:hypothetical protein
VSFKTRGVRNLSIVAIVAGLLISPLHSMASGEPVPPEPTVTSFTPSEGSASGGTRVTFTGTNLGDVTEVVFGTQAAIDPNVNETGTTLSVTSPAREGDVAEVRITLKTADRDVLLESSFTYLNDAPAEPDPDPSVPEPEADDTPPATTVMGMSPASGPTSGGQEVTFTGSRLNTVTKVTFGESAATDLTVNGDGTELRVTTPAGDAGSVNVTFTLTGATDVTFGPYEYLEPPTFAPFIVNGDDASPGEASWQVALISPGDNIRSAQFCGGSIINPRWIVTAAHCLQGTFANPANVRVLAGQQTLSGSGGQLINAARIINHPDYVNIISGNDVALIELANNLDMTRPGVGVIDLPFVESTASPVVWPPANTSGLITGWGNTKPGQITGDNPYVFPDTLQKATVSVVGAPGDAAGCAGWSVPPNDGYNPASMICVTGLTVAPKTPGLVISGCVGDSGGPFSVTQGGRPTLAGITSWGPNPFAIDGCNRPGFPSVYARVTSYVNWFVPAPPTITQILPGNGGVALVSSPPNTTSALPATKKVLEYSSDDGTTWSTAEFPAAGNISLLGGLTNGNEYLFRFALVSSVNESGPYFFSNVAKGIPSATAPTISSLSPTSGPTSGGTTVTIIGTNFNDVTGVSFAGTAATSFDRISSTEIRAITPARPAGAAGVIVANTSGSAIATTVFTFVAPPPPPTPDPGGGGGGGVPEPEPPAPPVPTPAPPAPPAQPPAPPASSPTLPPANAVTPEEVRELSPEQVSALPPEYVSALPPTAFSAFSPAQVAAMTPEQVAAIRPAGAAQLRPVAVRAMSADQLAVLRPAATGRLRPAAIRALDGKQLAAIQPAGYARMQPSQTAQLRPKQMSQIPSASVRSLTPRAIAAIPARVIARMTAAQVRSLTPAQSRALTPAQIRALNRASR